MFVPLSGSYELLLTLQAQSIPKRPSDLFPVPAAKRSIPCAPLHSLDGSTVIIAAAELLAYN